MIRFFLALAAMLSLAACGAPEREWPAPSPALWEIAGPNGEHGWLFGTIHALPDGAQWHTPTIDRAFASADLLMVEIGNLADPEEARKAFDAYARNGLQPPLSTRVPPADRPALTALMARAGMDEDDFWDIETWAAALMLSNAVRNGETANGVDRALLDGGKRVQALESFADQFARFDALGEEQEQALLAGIAREAQTDQESAGVEAWLTGDLAALEARMATTVLNRPDLRKSLVGDRNRMFAAGIALALEKGHRPFVAVGAGHMLGADGLPALLTARGYRVQRIQ